ncbi:LpqB family beta-propeller domain-containing protein [Nakamurella leprariae]|uniref:GerMN domain-containing protein n=1 Tax=Nakamurella leprariae TaxID=2803911 RepID=A0A939BX58_9ACTN|nr:LpqB family beta-propeller domain-containing protein [Nakamurella leprariae]MBM9468218.1 GerMN domain-containing protein [Nakamurella leprariae]
MRVRRRSRPAPRGWVALLAVATAVLTVLAGCSAVPGSGAARDIRQVADQLDEQAPAAPRSGLQPDQIVRGFIAASARPDTVAGASNAFASARQFLAADAQSDWEGPAGPVVVLPDTYRTESSTDDESDDESQVTVTAVPDGQLDEQRAFVPSSGADEPAFSYTMRLVREDGQWRISNPPNQLIIVSGDFPTAFQPRVVYFLDASATVVVPDLRYPLIGGTEVARADRLMQLLLRGPSSLLRGAAFTELGARAELRSNLSLDTEGVLTVDLTGVDTSTPAIRRALAAQIVWTLAATSPRIRITVDGIPLDSAQPVYTQTTMSSFDPDRVAGTGQVASDPYFVDTDGVVVNLENRQTLFDGSDAGTGPIRAVAMSAATGAVAAVADSGSGAAAADRQSLVIGRPLQDDRLAVTLRAGTLTAPAFTRTGDEVWVVQNGATEPEVVQVAAAGQASRARVDATALAGLGPVTALALSPDGVRVAVVAGGRLYLGGIAPVTGDTVTATATEPVVPGVPVPTTEPAAPVTDVPAASLAIVNLTLLRSDLSDASAVAFPSSKGITAAAKDGSGYRTLWSVSIDGKVATQYTTAGQFDDIAAFAVATAEQPLIAFGGRIWRLEGSPAGGQWVSPAPEAAAVNGSAPFYPG